MPKPEGKDPWAHRTSQMLCATCMWFVLKQKELAVGPPLGRCRRHAPTMSGYPAVFSGDWCGDHKLDENKV
jgi:hypothetical protein